MLALCVTIENDINPASVLVFLHLVNSRTASFFPVSVHLGNERFTAGTILSVASISDERRCAHTGKSDHCINLDVSKRLHVFSPSLIDDICVSVFLLEHVVKLDF